MTAEMTMTNRELRRRIRQIYGPDPNWGVRFGVCDSSGRAAYREGLGMTERNPLQMGMTPPGWPSPARLAAIMEAIRRGIERYRRELEDSERAEGEDENKLRDFPL